MKLRIRGNSIRIRVTQTELEQMGTLGRVSETIDFGAGARLTYALARTEDGDQPRVRFADGTITASIPAATVAEWVSTEAAAIGGEQPLGGGDVLTILVEKDFACLDPRPDEDESDMFAHPDAAKTS